MVRYWRILIYLTQWMPYGWNPSEMTKAFWSGERCCETNKCVIITNKT